MPKIQTPTSDKIELTKEGLADLKAELAELIDVRLPKVIARVSQARDHGDLSENSDYQNAKADQAIVESRVAEIEVILAKATIVKETKSHHKVGIGSTVVLSVKGKKNKYTYTLVGEFQANPEQGKISSVSPVGKALMGKKIKDVVEVKIPAGQISYLIEKIK